MAGDDLQKKDILELLLMCRRKEDFMVQVFQENPRRGLLIYADTDYGERIVDQIVRRLQLADEGKG